jgi:AraC family transcriptional regulator
MPAKLSNSPAAPGVNDRIIEKACWPGLECLISRENIAAGTSWAVSDHRHLVIVHLSGMINRLETELDGCVRRADPPMAGEIWFVPAGTRYASQAKGQVINYAELYFEPEYIWELCGRRTSSEEWRPQAGVFDDFIHRTLQYMRPLMTQVDDLSKLICQSLSQILCLHLYRRYGGSDRRTMKVGPAPGLRSRESGLIEDYISAHMSEHITLDALAGIAGMSSHQLLRAFPRSFGMTPAQYVIEKRLRRARRLLLTTDQDITSISLETGFASHSHLTTTFKNHTGLTPKEFRWSQRNK